MKEMGDDFNRDCLQVHNELRALHGCPPLEFDKDLVEYAQQWAEYLAATGQMEHSPESQEVLGENISMKVCSHVTEFTGVEASDEWYSQIQQYNFNEENQLKYGHFAQLIWKSTEKVGFGRAMCEDGRVFVVGQYLPPGNVMNQWRENVPPPLDGKIFQRTAYQDTPDGSQSVRDLKKNRSKNSPSSFSNSEMNQKRILRRLAKQPDILLEEFRKDVLKTHNFYRSQHGSRPLEHSDSLDNLAESWAECLSKNNVKTKCHFTYDDNAVGENTLVKLHFGKKVTGKEMVDNWYKEGTDYPYTEDPKSQLRKCGCFSQLLWNDSRKLGVGRITDEDDHTWLVCLYYPQGNIRNHFHENVHPRQT